MTRTLSFAALLMLVHQPLIMRHDVPDQAYIDFADSLAVTDAVFKYSQAGGMAGTLIDPYWILSAAHVAEYLSPGDSILTSRDKPVRIDSVILHPRWIENRWPEDIALIRLSEPAEGLPIVPIYRGDDEVGQDIVMIGNGDSGTGLTGPKSNDGKMRAATNRIDSADHHFVRWAFEDPAKQPEVLTRLEGISGPGDSSGPALIRVDDSWVIVGVSSHQNTDPTDGNAGRYGVIEAYTRVSTYAGWIDETLTRADR